MDLQSFFAGHPTSRAVFDKALAIARRDGPVEVRVGKSQVSLRQRRGFAYIWLPGAYLRKPATETVLAIALDRQIASTRFKQIAHPAGRVWMHHLEVDGPDNVDDEVAGWIREAQQAAR
ncbi:DUF5655 domain-containing protein [Pilimelia columellifera]|uniref:DUF5655 domain-containing protein n=1 Tax=Pilimelia columellifera subsp. columellifera TaxID=706583 RepID=A0ABN3N0Z0_9ACTN